MTPLEDIGVDILANNNSRFSGVVILLQISFSILKAVEPAFNYYVICVTALPSMF